MADGTAIEWTDATANVINGCSLESPGCTNCYAMKQAHRTEVRRGLTMHTKGGMVWTGDVRFHEPALLKVLAWQKPRMIFWNAHGDMFHPKVPIDWIDRCVAAMLVKRQHVHQVLTKRSARQLEYFRSLPNRDDYIREAARANGSTLQDCRDAAAAARCGMENHEHIWLGVSVEDQQRADERIPDLLATPAAVRWLSCEPLLGALDVEQWLRPRSRPHSDGYGGQGPGWTTDFNRIDWIVAGGESGPNARPMHPAWARSLRDQCAAAGVPFFWKQWGEWITGEQIGPDHPAIMAVQRDYVQRGRPELVHTFADGLQVGRVGKKAAGRLLDGVLHDGMPGATQP